MLDEDQKQWFAVDGKELRGSIQAGHTRGDVCLSAVAHQGQQVVGQTYYSGIKESELLAVRHLLEEQLCQQKITLDALHLIPIALRSIHQTKGVYLVGLKANQATLHRQCICQNLFKPFDYEYVDVEKNYMAGLSNAPIGAIRLTHYCWLLDGRRRVWRLYSA
ncbi:hypothetical protein [Spirosoma telluris]|uniref:hypothetical protein n=1 Tax=Spirosoma telluris TaxID=2183553 RepID=UPI002FC29E8E